MHCSHYEVTSILTLSHHFIKLHEVQILWIFLLCFLTERLLCLYRTLEYIKKPPPTLKSTLIFNYSCNLSQLDVTCTKTVKQKNSLFIHSFAVQFPFCFQASIRDKQEGIEWKRKHSRVVLLSAQFFPKMMLGGTCFFFVTSGCPVLLNCRHFITWKPSQAILYTFT